ncbi:MAG: adenylate/guanylate cyclase domain-containing protein [Synechococcus sp.]
MGDTLTVLFADVCDSTSLYETLGNQDAQRAIGASLLQIAAIVQDYQGRTIKMLGDGVLAVFESPSDACQAATTMQRQLSEYFRAGGIRSGIKVGLNQGAVVCDGGDVFGDAVNVAARLGETAKIDQILTTKSTVSALDSSWSMLVRAVDRLYVKGRRQRVDVCELIWKQEGLTVARFSAPPSIAQSPQLVLSVGELEIVTERQRPTLTIGRDADNDLTVESDLASRHHARIEYRRSRFYLVDRSTNGTYIYLTSTPPVFVRWEEVILKGQGWLGLGEEVDADAPQAIRFQTQMSPQT